MASKSPAPAASAAPAAAEIEYEGKHNADGQREGLASDLEPVTVEPGEIVVQAGDPGDALFLIKSGGVLLTANEAARRSAVLDQGATPALANTKLQARAGR